MSLQIEHFGRLPVPCTTFSGSMLLPVWQSVSSWYTSSVKLEYHGFFLAMILPLWRRGLFESCSAVGGGSLSDGHTAVPGAGA